MNTKNLKAYAPKARREFIAAVKKRAAHFGIYEDRIEEVRIEGGAAIIEGRAFTRKEGEQRKRLESKIAERTSATYQEKYDMFIREMAYTWFNRLAAIRYMELHDYFDHGFRVLSPAPIRGLDAQGSANVAGDRMSGATPEILSHASDVADSLALDKSHIIELQLAGDKEEALYRELLLGQCHQLAKIMPQIFKGLGFEALDDATELLLPNNLTKTDSILKGLINDIPEEDWQEIEVIGWLYQFYISEHKDAVIGKVVKSEDIPAATQLFTPNWIVKYLVQNSLGRQWLATYPDSKLVEALKETDRKKKVKALEFKGEANTNHIEGDVYYIEPAEQSEEVIEQLKANTPTSIDPEEIKVLDPACGSGHILVEVYEVFREIYLERGYRLREIPELILTKNIYGLDIDDRAAQLACFALMMKAREDDRRIFQRVEEGEVSINVFSLQSTEHLDIPKLWKALDLEGNQQIGSTVDLFDELSDDTTNAIPSPAGIYVDYYQLLQILKTAFLQAKTLGSLIQIDAKHLDNLLSLKQRLLEKLANSDTQSKPEIEKILPIINQAIMLAQRYDALVANPPYLGSKGMNAALKEHAKMAFPNSKSDLFAMFIERGFGILKDYGFNSMVTMQSWMFLSSYEDMRDSILRNYTIENMLHMGNGVMKIAFGTNATVFRNVKSTGYKGRYSYCENSDINDEGVPFEFPVQNERLKTAASDDFKKIPGSPIAYWVDEQVRSVFENGDSFEELATPRQGLGTGNNSRFTRYWWEVSRYKVVLESKDKHEALSSNGKWFPYTKGGGFKKWFGNELDVVNWEEDGKEIRLALKGMNPNIPRSEEHYFKKGVTWGLITSSAFSARYCKAGAIFDVGGSKAMPNDSNLWAILGFLNSKLSGSFLKTLNPTLNFQVGDLKKLPILNVSEQRKFDVLVKEAVTLTEKDWNSCEFSMNFDKLSLLGLQGSSLKSIYSDLIGENSHHIERLRQLEENLNDNLIKLYGLENSYSSKVDTQQITLESNPLYLYSVAEISTEVLNRFNSKVAEDLISFSLGCMMGRYSLALEGLVYAHAGNEGFKELEAEGAYKSFPADDDGIIPLASEEWLFDDDATTRFKEFVKTVWGDEHLSENLEFVAESLCLHAIKPLKGNKGQGESAMDTIRRYFSTQFFKDHCKTYKKRPIYWLFSSGKEKAFECLVYLHRYNEGTLSRMRTEYVTPLMGKYDAQLARLSDDMVNATGSEARRIEKDIKALEKKQAELRTFDEQLKHYAEKRITLDLDDGVKENYGKFGNLLADVKAIHGKAVK